MGFLNKLFGKGTKTEQGAKVKQGAKVDQVTRAENGAKVEQVTFTKKPDDSLPYRTEQELI